MNKQMLCISPLTLHTWETLFCKSGWDFMAQMTDVILGNVVGFSIRSE